MCARCAGRQVEMRCTTSISDEDGGTEPVGGHVVTNQETNEDNKMELKQP